MSFYLDKVMGSRTEYNFQKSGLKLMQGLKTGLENNMFSLKWGRDLRTVQHTPTENSEQYPCPPPWGRWTHQKGEVNSPRVPLTVAVSPLMQIAGKSQAKKIGRLTETNSLFYGLSL